jgi:phosphotransferase system IIB component
MAAIDTNSEDFKRRVACMKKILLGVLIADYGARELGDSSAQELKMLVNRMVATATRIQAKFINDNPQTKEVFKKQFISSEIFMISELVSIVYGLSDESIEDIIKAVTKAMEPEEQLNPS